MPEIKPKSNFRAVFASERVSGDFVANVLQFRKHVLVDTLGWQLSVVGGVERDEFDTPDAVHCGILNGDDLIACFRAIRCDQPYLSRSIFPELASRRAYPGHAFAWEISRFAVSDRHRRFEAALLNYSVMFHFAHTRGAVSLVAFCDLAHERLLGMLGIKTERFGEPVAIGADSSGRAISVTAGEIPISRQSGVRFEKLISLSSTMDIEDAAAAVGHSRVSA